jgi:hypothetical protein
MKQSLGRSVCPPEIPFRYQDGLIWFKVELVGKKARLNFLRDSGASVSAQIVENPVQWMSLDTGCDFSFGVGGYENGKEANERTIDRFLSLVGPLYQHFGPARKRFFQ